MDENLPAASKDFFFRGIKIDKVLDVKYCQCPLPILKTRLALSKLSKGQVLKVITTDSASLKDFHSYCRINKQSLILSEEFRGAFVHLLRKQ